MAEVKKFEPFVLQREGGAKYTNSKIDSLYDVLNQHRASEDKLKDENMELRLQLQEASWNRCIRNGCERRSPPRKREQEKENYTDRTDEEGV